jgi:hypothetical protein
MSSTIDNTALLAALNQIEKTVAQMKEALGASGESKPFTTPKKAKKEKDPDAPKKEANPWIKFTQRVSNLLKEAKIETGPATVSKQFASALKDQKAYEEWTDEAILAAWPTWEKPTESKMAKKKSATSGGETSADEAVATEEPKAKKEPKSTVKRAAKKTAKTDEE